ncbi:MAG: PPOX class F420-dependent oxidoreductase [Propionibacterium sp.]|nr:PPOX class F420-dependent oxidoreductase [Propionibacterium sp.]
MVTFTDSQKALLARPIYASLGTIRPDNTVTVNPMWFEFDGEVVKFTHTSTRGKYRNLQQNPSMCLMVLDPDNPFNYAELRGSLKEVVEDPTGSFWVHLAERYGNPGAPAPDDSPDRVILVMQIDRILGFTG